MNPIKNIIADFTLLGSGLIFLLNARGVVRNIQFCKQIIKVENSLLSAHRNGMISSINDAFIEALGTYYGSPTANSKFHECHKIVTLADWHLDKLFILSSFILLSVPIISLGARCANWCFSKKAPTSQGVNVEPKPKNKRIREAHEQQEQREPEPADLPPAELPFPRPLPSKEPTPEDLIAEQQRRVSARAAKTK